MPGFHCQLNQIQSDMLSSSHPLFQKRQVFQASLQSLKGDLKGIDI